MLCHHRLSCDPDFLYLLASSKPALEIHLSIGNCRGFCRGKQCFNSDHLGKYIAEVIIPSKIHIQFTIFNTYLSTKFLFTDKRCHLHVLEKCLYVLQKVRSIIYFLQFIHPLSLRSRSSETNFAFTSYIILSTKSYDVTFLNNFYFVSLFYHLFICRRQRKIRLVTLEVH